MRASVKAYATPRPPESTQNHSYESRLDPDPLEAAPPAIRAAQCTRTRRRIRRDRALHRARAFFTTASSRFTPDRTRARSRTRLQTSIFENGGRDSRCTMRPLSVVSRPRSRVVRAGDASPRARRRERAFDANGVDRGEGKVLRATRAVDARGRRERRGREARDDRHRAHRAYRGRRFRIATFEGASSSVRACDRA